MAVTTSVLSGTITDLIGSLETKYLSRLVLVIESNTDGSMLLDTSGNRVMAGAKRVPVDTTTGAYTATLVRTDSADIVPATGRLYRATLIYPSGTPGAGNERQTSGWFELTADSNLAAKWTGLDVIAVTEALYESISDSVAAVEADRVAVADHRTAVEAVVATNDGLMAAVDADAASAFRVQQDARHASTYATVRMPAFEGLVAALDEGVESVGLALVGDSTGNATDEWFYMVGQELGTAYPDYTVHWRAWNDTSQSFDRPTVVQAGAAGTRKLTVNSGGGAAAWEAAGITGDLDVVVYCKPTTWRSGTQTLVSRFGNGGANVDRAFRFQVNSSGNLLFDWSTDGSTLQTGANSGTTVPFANGVEGWVRVQLDVDDGAGGHTIKFYTSSNGTSWTQLGSTVTRATGSTSIAAAASWQYELGARTGSAEVCPGDYYEVYIRDGIDGPSVVPARADNWTIAQATNHPTISGAPVLTLTSGSHAGASLTYLNDTTRIKKLTPQYLPAAVFLSNSHNEGRSTGSAWINDYSSWVTNVKARLPFTPVVILTQNPRTSPATQIEEHATRRRQIMSWARSQGLDFIDTFGAFASSSIALSSLIAADGIHPTTGGGTSTGSTLWTNTIMHYIAL